MSRFLRCNRLTECRRCVVALQRSNSKIWLPVANVTSARDHHYCGRSCKSHFIRYLPNIKIHILSSTYS
ncbi:hypothetical protein FWK35_00014675 [Aphis craccivora]|uniref:Uncharacterized protein n=1 Tax=Aphis craccivora TaxID=307492 RepID=A0A6G0ZCC0_APHCR|nr:hypothetical protein FWK35_00014675 [Aphis craccivora]